jgi:hypothetical protein
MVEHKTYREAIQRLCVVPNATSQRTRILRLLIDARGAWVPLPEILTLGIVQYRARILEVRRRGFIIENKTDRMDGARHSWFRLIASPATPAPKPEPDKLSAPETLFDLSRDPL